MLLRYGQPVKTDRNSQTKNWWSAQGSITKGFHERDEERVARVTLERKMVKIDDLRQDQSFLRTEWVVQNGFIAYLGIPIIVKEGVTGVLELFYRSPFRGTPGESDMLDDIAKQTSLLIYIVKVFRKIHHHGQLSRIQDQQVQSERVYGAEEFMAKAAHQLNYVLTAISGYAQLLKISIQDEQLKENADMIFNGVSKASAITGTQPNWRQQPAEQHSLGPT